MVNYPVSSRIVSYVAILAVLATTPIVEARATEVTRGVSSAVSNNDTPPVSVAHFPETRTKTGDVPKKHEPTRRYGTCAGSYTTITPCNPTVSASSSQVLTKNFTITRASSPFGSSDYEITTINCWGAIDYCGPLTSDVFLYS